MPAASRLAPTPVVIALLSALYSPAAKADAVEDFYRGKTISLLIGYAAGGGYDQYARLLARHVGQYIPGKPTIVPRNMPGAGSLSAINNLYNVAPRDGTSMVTFGPEVAFEPLRGGDGVQFDTLQFNWIGSMNRQVGLAVMSANSKIRTILDARTKEVTVGASGSGSQSNLNPKVYNAFLGTKFKVITGYPGTKDITLAMERGEIDGIAGWSWDSLKLERPAWAASKDFNLVMQVSDRRHPEIPNVPNIYDYVENPDDKTTLELIFGHQLLGRPFIMAPGVPTDRVEAARNAFDATMKDPKFLNDAEAMRLEIDAVGGKEIETHVRRVFSMPKALIDKAALTIRAATAVDR
jgi:tripartite-type tricarboxylate transporter receptor subunit TctC